MDCGLDFGGLEGRWRDCTSAGASFSTLLLLNLLNPVGMLGLPSKLEPVVADKKGERPMIGDTGGAPLLSLSRFSNLDRSEDTGLMEVSSLPSPGRSILRRDQHCFHTDRAGCESRWMFRR